ncbi:MAG TPA: hypothetical protein PLW86_17730 [Rhodocyclaceae bacterium]|nr:hypothetical protein [Rhodocyclaceae bacterium]
MTIELATGTEHLAVQAGGRQSRCCRQEARRGEHQDRQAIPRDVLASVHLRFHFMSPMNVKSDFHRLATDIRHPAHSPRQACRDE